MEKITVKTAIKAPVEKVWDKINNPADIERWNHASEDWHCLNASNDLRVGGILKSTMAAKNGSFSFDFEGTYDEIIPYQLIRYHLGDGREVEIKLEVYENNVMVTEIFDAEQQNSADMQRQGWQAILDSFKNYVEGN